jgi:hypothetical protein
MQLEMRGPGASSQATGAMVSNAYNSNIRKCESEVNALPFHIDKQTCGDGVLRGLRDIIEKAALDIARKGKPVFPVNIKKVPLTPNGFKDATTDPDTIREMVSRAGVAGIATPTGPASGLLVIDRDRKHGVDGIASCKELEAELGALPDTLQQRTGSGGDQLFFQFPEGVEIPCSAGKVAPGIDIRSAGGYVVLPPSVNEDGPYMWLNRRQPAQLPQAWVERLAKKKKAENKPYPVGAVTHSEYADAALKNECGKVVMASEGSRNETLNAAAFSLGQLVGAGRLEEGVAVSALERAGLACGLDEDEVDKTVRSGMKAGIEDPRQPAPLSSSAICAASCNRVDEDKHASAKERFPRTPFPWHILPANIERSLKQLARACATSETPLPGAAFCLVASAVGRQFAVSPKPSWIEPLIFWSGDIRNSGDGKTGAMRLMSKTVEDAQVKACEDAEDEEKKNSASSASDKKAITVRPRAYFTTNMTLEGIQNDLVSHPTGGIVVLLNELSAFVNSQGEYKGGKGTDRESWLSLYDGSPVRVTRAKETRMIKGARVQVCGGIQPDIFKKIFSGNNGTFLEDGTIFRFLLTYEKSSFYPLTLESWNKEERDAWTRTLNGAFHWANTNDPVTALCTDAAQDMFITWRNEIMSQKEEFQRLFGGFIPKAVGYAARLAGVIHLIHAFSSGKYPSNVLDVEDMRRGIIAAEFYLGQALDAISLIIGGENYVPADVSPRSAEIAKVLNDLRDEVDNGRLAVAYVQERFNQYCTAEQRVSNPKTFTSMLRGCGLPVLPGTHTANGKRSVTCLAWNDVTESFVNSSLFSLFPLQAHGWQGLAGAEEKNSSSASSAQDEPDDSTLQRTQSREILPLQPVTYGWQGSAEKTEETEETSARIVEVEVEL